MKKILLVIPAYNEEDNILNTYNFIKEYSFIRNDVGDLI